MINFGAQLFTFRNALHSVSDMERVFESVREEGGGSVQLSGLKFAYDAASLRALAADHGIEIPLTHTAWKRISEDTDNVIKEHKALGADTVGLGIMPSEYYRSAEALDSFVGAVNAVSRKLADAGLRFAYHNHAFEFLPFEGGGRLIDILAECCPDLDFIFDIYWCRYAGFDPAAEMKKLSGRIRHIHLKDGFSFFRIPVITAVGRGRLDIPSVLSAAAECGTKYAYFEHDFTPDPYKFTRKSFAAVRKIPGVELRV